MDEHIIIIGAGHGGVQAATSLREEGYQGALTLVSADPELPYHKPPLSKTFLKAQDAAPQILKAQMFYDAQNIALRLGSTVASIDPTARTLTLEDGATLAWSKLLLATGARPRRLAVPGSELDGVFYLRECADARLLRERTAAAGDVVVIGGGFIGLEVAATMAMSGKRVTVVEAADRLLGRAVSAPVSSHMRAYHEGLGIRVLTRTGVRQISGQDGDQDGGVRAVVTDAGEAIPADAVLVGIGAEPDTRLAEAAGILCDNGIRVDAACRTSAPGIFAIGDCVSFPHQASGRVLRLESVQNATDQARCAAKAMLGRPADFDAVAWFWSDQGERKLQMAGLAFDIDRQVLSGDLDAGAFAVFLFSGERLVALETVNRPGEHMLGRRMLAAGFSPTDAQIAEGPAALKAALAAHGMSP
ncbi:NAD(P)/FAD-dependent oxidoreductase [Nitratireductor soli]|uniref:NAD(P)/FAD-dependent oxidoreductase n=1 Tax=Nitratireductor soli TaxID=1670619 RepID=UPI00138EDC1F|nr:FAD-dependent oxidoreductase [Nitratireductor soli]